MTEAASTGQSDTGRLPRGTCPTCGNDVALRVDGQLREHRPEGMLCPASGYTIKQAEAKIAGEVAALRRMGR